LNAPFSESPEFRSFQPKGLRISFKESLNFLLKRLITTMICRINASFGHGMEI